MNYNGKMTKRKEGCTWCPHHFLRGGRNSTWSSEGAPLTKHLNRAKVVVMVASTLRRDHGVGCGAGLCDGLAMKDGS